MSTVKEELLQIIQGPELPEENLRRRLAKLIDVKLKPDKMSYEEFLAWADEDSNAEWVDGEVVMHSPASNRHQDIGGFLESVLRIYCANRTLGIVIRAPFQMKLARSGREPDLLFLKQEHLDRLHDTRLEGPADVAIEIISRESIGRDRGEKYQEYEEAGVPEFWLIDPDRRSAEFHRLDANGRYQVVLPDAEGTYHSREIPGFWLRVAWLWQQPLPPVDEILLEIGGEDFAERLIQHLRQRGYLR